VANGNSPDSLELANTYRVKRQVPPEQVLRIAWTGGNIQWTRQEFIDTLLNPVLARVNELSRSNQIQYVVLSMDIPYRISDTQSNSTTSALFYGYKTSSGFNNSYAFSETRFAAEKPSGAPTNAFLAMMLTGQSLEEAKALIDQGISSDGTRPQEVSWLVKSSDSARNKRYKSYDNAIFDTRLCDGYCMRRTNTSSSPPWTDLLGCQLGLANFSVSSNAFVPGAIADSMTSFGGQIFENSGQTSLLEFLQSGAAGSYGTVTEPTAVTAKFPDPMVYFYQSRGFTLAECYYQSLQQPYQGLLVGEPLAAPWRRSAIGGWVGACTNDLLTGVTGLTAAFASDLTGPCIERLDLFIDGAFAQTLTNLPPTAGNRLTVRLNGYGMEYEVPANATLKSIAAVMAALLNQEANTNITKVKAKAYGDRIELQSYAAPLPDGVFEFVDDQATASVPRSYLAVPGPYPLTCNVSAPTVDPGGAFRLQFESAPGVSNALQASANLFEWETITTNPQGGLLEYAETNTSGYPQRFYRLLIPAPKPTPQLISLGLNPSNQFGLQVVSPTNQPYIVQCSADFNVWSDLWTNAAGTDASFVDPQPALGPGCFYRTRSGDSNDYAPVSLVGQTPSGGNILQVQDTAPGDIVVWSTTNGTEWSVVYTLVGSPNIQTETYSASGGEETLTTRFVSAEPLFLESTAQGFRGFGVELGWLSSLTDASRLNLQVTKTNGLLASLSVTNPAGNSSLSNFVRTFIDAVNSTPDLMGLDGVEADDLLEGFPGQFLLNLYARGEGRRAARIQAQLTGSADLFTTPAGAVQLNQNLTDLLPRNHLYVRAGMPSLTHEFVLDTTSLPDGHHDLTVVAYEGSHVYSQTLGNLHVVVSNSPLAATLTLEASDPVLSVTNSFDLTVTVNTNDIAGIQLYTTGGLYAEATNQSTAVFKIKGSDLGAGQHPFHALVTTSDGLRYRTAELPVILTR
jgi:uncharacterized protein (TIGR03790 family)